MDHKDADMIQIINLLPYKRSIRQEEAFIREEDCVFWKLNKKIQLNREATHPRILICGQTGAGKSALINEVLGQEMVCITMCTPLPE